MSVIINVNGQTTEYKSIPDMVLNLLVHEELDFADLATKYVNYLRLKNSINAEMITQADIIALCASGIETNTLFTKQEKEDFAIWYLSKYNRFDGAPVKQEIDEKAEERNLNLSGRGAYDMYIED